jgi:hypothetical protein
VVKALLLVVGFALLAYLVSRWPIHTMLEVAGRLDWTIFLVLLIPLLWFLANTCGLWLLTGRRVPFGPLFYNRLVGDGYNAIVPLAGVGGEPIRVRHLSRYVPVNEAATWVVADRAINEISGLAVAALAILAGAGALAWPQPFKALVVPVALAGLVATIVLLRITMGRAPSWLAGVALRLIGQAGLSAPQGLPRKRVAAAFGMNVLGRIAGLAEAALLLSALHIHVGPMAALGIGGILLISGAVALIIPQGIGVLEAVSVFALSMAGAPPPVGLAFGLVRRGRMLLYGVAGVVLHLISPVAGLARQKEPRCPA